MTEFHFSLPKGFYGRFVSDQELWFGSKEQLLLKAYVPGITIGNYEGPFTKTISHRESVEAAFSVREDFIEIRDQWRGKVSMDLYHLLSGVARQHYLENHLYPTHAACLGLDDLVLLVGHSGSGKTSIALELLKDKEMKLFSGNTTVVSFEDDSVMAVAGTPTITARAGDLKERFAAQQYADRGAFSLAGAQYANPGKIKAAVVVRLNDKAQEWNKLSSISAIHTLYPYFLDTVHADTVVCGKFVHDGAIRPEVKSYLAMRLADTLPRIPVYTACGSLPFVAGRILGLTK